MPVTIDEVTAQVDPTQATTPPSEPSNSQNQQSQVMELRLQRELQNHLAVRAARLHAD